MVCSAVPASAVGAVPCKVISTLSGDEGLIPGKAGLWKARSASVLASTAQAAGRLQGQCMSR